MICLAALLVLAPPVATVNGVSIDRSEVVEILYDLYGRSVTDDLIRREVVRQAAKQQKVVWPPKELDSEYARQLEQIRRSLPVGADLDSAMQTKGLGRKRLRVLVETDFILDRLALRQFRAAEFVKTSTILVVPKTPNTDDLMAAIKKADDAFARLGKGEAWSRVLETTVDDAGYRREDGLIGWRRLATFPESVRSALATTKAGTILKPVQTNYGIQIFRVDAIGSTAGGAELADLRRQFAVGSRERIMRDLMAKAKIVR